VASISPPRRDRRDGDGCALAHTAETLGAPKRSRTAPTGCAVCQMHFQPFGNGTYIRAALRTYECGVRQRHTQTPDSPNVTRGGDRRRLDKLLPLHEKPTDGKLRCLELQPLRGLTRSPFPVEPVSSVRPSRPHARPWAVRRRERDLQTPSQAWRTSSRARVRSTIR
jgi:hypothetical protein